MFLLLLSSIHFAGINNFNFWREFLFQNEVIYFHFNVIKIGCNRMSENRGYLSSLVLCGIQATYLPGSNQRIPSEYPQLTLLGIIPGVLLSLIFWKHSSHSEILGPWKFLKCSGFYVQPLGAHTRVSEAQGLVTQHPLTVMEITQQSPHAAHWIFTS